MSNTCAVFVDPSTMSLSATGLIHGVITFRIGDYWFPGKAWDDFPVVVASWWLEKLLKKSRGTRDLFFMDGPLWLVIQHQTSQRLQAYCMEGSYFSPKIRHSCLVDRRELCIEVLRAAEILLAACVQREWNTSDVLSLAEDITRAKRSRRFR